MEEKKLTSKDFKRRIQNTGYIKDPLDERDFLFKTTSQFQTIVEAEDKVLTLPSKVDHTPEMSLVKDQGRLGSCVSFAVAAMKEWQEQKEHDKEVAEGKKYTREAKNYDLSESWIYWNAKKIDAWPGQEGTSIRYAMKVLQRIGVPTEKGWPYDDIDFGKPEIWAPLVARWSLIESYWSIGSVLELKTALVNSPVPIGVGVYREIYYVTSNGIIPYPAEPNNPIGGHAICAVGYDDSNRLIKFKNSWSRYWGQSGYGYISYDYIEDFMWDAWAAKDIAVTHEMLKGVRTLV